MVTGAHRQNVALWKRREGSTPRRPSARGPVLVCVCPTRISQCYSLSHTHFQNCTLGSSRAPQPWKPSSLSPIRPLINSIKQRRDTLSNSLSDDVMPSRAPLSKFPHKSGWEEVMAHVLCLFPQVQTMDVTLI